MAKTPDSIAVLIPAYKPDERLLTLCRALAAEGLPIAVVDDGSGPAFAHIFGEAAALGAMVSRHAVNLGKGRALKTGLNALLQHIPGLAGVVTADADGQHTPSDVRRVMEAMRARPKALVIGARAFTGNVPLKSRLGNAITRQVYRFVAGVRCSDTQTGLRGLPASALPALIQMAGERYEYEMAMLLRLRDLGLPLVEVPIETIYLDGNRGSHFSPLRDAARIYAVIFRFALSSIVSFCVDYGLYLLLFGRLGLAAWLAYVLARLVSAAMNYALNRVVVFGPGGGRWAFARYGLVAALQLAVGTCLVHALTLWFPGGEWWIKVPVDALLFFVSYAAQRRFVFSENHSLKEE